MRKTNTVFALLLSTLVSLTAVASQGSADLGDSVLAREVFDTLRVSGQVGAYDLINWKVGDQSDFEVKAFGGMISGTLHKEAMREEGGALWVTSTVDLMNNHDVTEILINRADAKILKMIHNGKEEAMPTDEIEIISQEYTDITVPAGTFNVIHVTAKSPKISKIEIWANPRDIVMEGTAKQAVAAQFGEIVMVLTKFQRGN